MKFSFLRFHFLITVLVLTSACEKPVVPGKDDVLQGLCKFNDVSILNHASIKAWQNSSVPFGSTCVSQDRACADGILSGSYPHFSCEVAAPASCLFDGRPLAHGASVTAWQKMPATTGSICLNQTRTCSNGSLSGSYPHSSCEVAAPASCSFNGQSLAHGASVTAWQEMSPSTGASCLSETRTCTDGSLSGSYEYAACAARPAYEAPTVSTTRLRLSAKERDLPFAINISNPSKVSFSECTIENKTREAGNIEAISLSNECYLPSFANTLTGWITPNPKLIDLRKAHDQVEVVLQYYVSPAQDPSCAGPGSCGRILRQNIEVELLPEPTEISLRINNEPTFNLDGTSSFEVGTEISLEILAKRVRYDAYTKTSFTTASYILPVDYPGISWQHDASIEIKGGKFIVPAIQPYVYFDLNFVTPDSVALKYRTSIAPALRAFSPRYFLSQQIYTKESLNRILLEVLERVYKSLPGYDSARPAQFSRIGVDLNFWDLWGENYDESGFGSSFFALGYQIATGEACRREANADSYWTATPFSVWFNIIRINSSPWRHNYAAEARDMNGRSLAEIYPHEGEGSPAIHHLVAYDKSSIATTDAVEGGVRLLCREQGPLVPLARHVVLPTRGEGMHAAARGDSIGMSSELNLIKDQQSSPLEIRTLAYNFRDWADISSLGSWKYLDKYTAESISKVSLSNAKGTPLFAYNSDNSLIRAFDMAFKIDRRAVESSVGTEFILPIVDHEDFVFINRQERPVLRIDSGFDTLLPTKIASDGPVPTPPDGSLYEKIIFWNDICKKKFDEDFRATFHPRTDDTKVLVFDGSSAALLQPFQSALKFYPFGQPEGIKLQMEPLIMNMPSKLSCVPRSAL